MHPVQYEPGQILAGTVYRVIRHLATGGMGSVYDVEDTTVEKRYVLKTLHPQLVSREDLARRMRDEAKSLAKLQHPNIVDVITAGITKDDVKMPFYVMERLIGQNLRVVLEKKSVLDLVPAYRIAIDVADALEHAHENSIVHRDVKPENIFLHRNANGTTTTKLLDFGIVRLLDRKASHTHGKFIGTLRYASPEQITGRAIGPSTDIYSLAVVLYEMLCGRGPFDDAGDQYAIGAAHASDPPPPLSRFARVDPGIERLLATALAKEPADRPRDCFTFASELRRLLGEAELSPASGTIASVLATAAPATEKMEHTPLDTGVALAVDGATTTTGMVPPSRVAPASSPGEELATSGDTEDSAPVSPVAPTVAAGEVLRSRVEVAGEGAGAKRPIDRRAETRASTLAGATQRLAPNDTQIEDPEQPASDPAGAIRDDAVRAALAAPAPLIVPPLAASYPSGDLVFRSGPVHAPVHAPVHPPFALDGRSAARSRERGPFILVTVAAVLALAMVGSALIMVRWRGERARSATRPVAMAPAAPATSTSVPEVPPSGQTEVPPSGGTEVSSAVPAPPPPPVVAQRGAPPPVAAVARSASPSKPGSTTGAAPRPTSSGHAPAIKFEP